MVANFVNKGLTPDFDKVWKKQREWWNEFVNYKHSADSMAASIQGKINASKKQTSINLGLEVIRLLFQNEKRWKMI